MSPSDTKLTRRWLHLENRRLGSGVVLRTDAERFVQPRSVGRACLVEDRYEPAVAVAAMSLPAPTGLSPDRHTQLME